MLEQLAWPGVVAVVAIIFIFVFKTPITRLIDRTSKVGPTGLTATPAIQESGKSVEPPSGEQLKEFDNAILVKYEAKVRDDLEGRRFASPGDKEKFLIRTYTAVFLGLAFEKIYLQIYGSQLAALHFLNTQGAAGAEEKAIFSEYFSRAKSNHPEVYNFYAFEPWLQYLSGRDLVSRKGTRLTITEEGREFLKYIIHQGYTLIRPY